MRGHVLAAEAAAEGLAPWESLVVEAVGNTIEFWGFKTNQGRVWALLYLRGRAMTAAEIQRELGLSKGAVSMVTRELEQWGVVQRVRAARAGSWSFEAETDLLRMVSRVISEREARFIARVTSDLDEAERRARATKNANPAAVERVARLHALARLTGHAVDVFLRTARLDVKGIADVLRGSAAKVLQRRR